MIMTCFKTKIYLPFLLAVLAITVFFSCESVLDVSSPNKFVQFSKDTLTFDTVFTTIGSATSKIMVYNNQRKDIVIENIRLSGGKNSPFRINVDGSKDDNHSFSDITIKAKDSLYIFVEINIDPNNNDNPVLVQDSIVFTTNNINKRVVLEAFGQDVEILKGKVIRVDTTLNSNKPYLIYDSLKVIKDVSLTLHAGTKIYFHNNASLLVYGNLKVDGTFENPVEIKGDRLDKAMFDTPIPYKYIAGQWGGVFLLSKTGNHILNNLNISSGYVGLYFYNEDRNYKPYLEINNCKIHNFLVYNLIAVNGDLRVTNSEITNSGSYTVYLSGGKHEFYHCTIANFYSNSSGRPNNRDNTPAVMLMDLNKVLPMETIFKNCIISGTSSTEFILASKFREQYKGEFSHTYIKRSEADSLPIFNEIRWWDKNDTTFVNNRYDYKDGQYFNFVPDSISPARGIADPAISTQFPIDLNGKSRLEDGEPDAGAYEWYPKSN